MQMNIQGVFTEASLTGKLHERQYVATETKSVIAMCDGGGGTSPGMYGRRRRRQCPAAAAVLVYVRSLQRDGSELRSLFRY